MIHLHDAPSALAAVMRSRGLEVPALCAHVHPFLLRGGRQGSGIAGNRAGVRKNAHDVGPFGHKTKNLQLSENEHALPRYRHHSWHYGSLTVNRKRIGYKKEQIGGKEDEVDYDAGEHSAAAVVHPVLRILLRTAQVLAHRKRMTGVCQKQQQTGINKWDAIAHSCDTSQSPFVRRTQC